MGGKYDRDLDKVVRSKGFSLHDQKIVDLLRRNCRLTNTEIGKIIGISKERVLYRIKRLEKVGVIRGYHTFINKELMGFTMYYVMLSFNDVSRNTREILMKKLESLKYTRMYFALNGEYDLSLMLNVREPDELRISFDFIKEICKNNLKKITLMVNVKEKKKADVFGKVITSNGNYSRSSYENYFLKRKKAKDKVKVDASDIKIIKAIQNQANMPLLEIANITGLSTNTVNERLKRMVSSGLIEGFRASLAYQEFGLNHYRIYVSFSHLDAKLDKEFENFFKDVVSNTVETYVGEYDYAFGVYFTSGEVLNKFMKAMRDKFGDSIKAIDIAPYGGKHWTRLSLY
jgi:DNA-binding Lrp family transcriptional regulator